jgi:uncharacterized membrane-anchored protein YhcB (DUF1043 family)
VDAIEPVWLFAAIVLTCGIFLGMLINRLLNPSSADVNQLKSDLERERAEMERYKASVNSHFNKTSDLVKELTQDYVKVYQHLAEGAQTLSDTPEFTQVLEQPQGRVSISVESEADEAVVLADVNATADSPESLQAEPLQAEAPQADEPSATAAMVDSPEAPQAQVPQVDEISAAEVAAPSDYARGGEDDEVAAQPVHPDTDSSDDTDKAADQDSDKEVKSAAAVTEEAAAAADSPSTPADETVKQTVADEGEAKPVR